MKTIRRLLRPRQKTTQPKATTPIPQDPTHSPSEWVCTPLQTAKTRILLTRLLHNAHLPHIIESILDHAEYWHLLTSSYTHISQLPNNGLYHPSCLIAETPPLRLLRSSATRSSTSETHPPLYHLRKVVIQLTTRRGHGLVLGRDRECCSWFDLMVRRPRAYGPAPNPNSSPSASAGAIECAPGRNFALYDDESAVGRAVQPDYCGELNPILCDIEASVRPPVRRTFTFFPGFALAIHQHQLAPGRHYTPLPPGTLNASSTNPRFFEEWKRRDDGAYDHHGTNGEDGLTIPRVEGCDTYGDVGGCMALIRGLVEGDRLAVVANVAYPGLADNVESVGVWVYAGAR